MDRVLPRKTYVATKNTGKSFTLSSVTLDKVKSCSRPYWFRIIDYTFAEISMSLLDANIVCHLYLVTIQDVNIVWAYIYIRSKQLSPWASDLIRGIDVVTCYSNWVVFYLLIDNLFAL